MDNQTIQTYNEMSLEYDEETKDFWSLFPDTIITKFADEVGARNKVLDLGSGPGRDGILLKNKGLEITCLDASQKMVELCREKGLYAIEGDLLEIPFNENSFDGVWSYTSLLHIKKNQLKKAIQEIKRVLKPNGIFGLGLIEGEDELYRESSGVNMPRWFAFYTKEELEEIFQKHGLEIIYFEEFTPRSKKYLNYILRNK
jgi:ubiquinone/menaquinone biosynthesis C-methylase UbiE